MFDPKYKISPHFTAGEVAKSSTADRLELYNIPSSDIIANAQALAINVLEPIRAHFGRPMSPQSWYRGEELEKAITTKSFANWCVKHGRPNNRESWEEYFSRKSHPRGEAVDIEIPGVSNDDLYNWIASNLKFDQLIREFAKPNDPMSGWVHVSWKEEKTNRNQSFSIG